MPRTIAITHKKVHLTWDKKYLLLGPQPQAKILNCSRWGSILTDYRKQHWARHKAPKRIDFVNDLPLRSVGKVLRREVRRKFWKEKEREIHEEAVLIRELVCCCLEARAILGIPRLA